MMGSRCVKAVGSCAGRWRFTATSACRMNEPLVCWTFMILVLCWGACTCSNEYQQKLTAKFGRFHHFLQWYFAAGLFLLWLFEGTLENVIRFEYIDMNLLSPDTYREQHLNPNKTHIGLSHDELYGLELTIPSFLRWISLVSPIAGIFTFGLASCSTLKHMLAHDPLASRTTEFLHTVVLGMPLVFVTMALRATTRQWAVMTGTAWTADCQRQELCQVMWEDVKAARIATYEQDLHVASAFQFFAVGCFGQVCKQALNAMVNNSGSERDSRILRQLAVLGIWTFVGLGIVQTVANIIFAMISSDPDKIPFVAPIQSKVTKTLDPVFLCATVLSVINMFLLSRIEEVERVLPRANQRFHATRALLLIGQGQITVLSAFVTSNAGANPVIKALQHFNIIKDVPFDLGIHQIRLLHSSLLCFECLMVAIVNHIVWKDPETYKRLDNTNSLLPLDP